MHELESRYPKRALCEALGVSRSGYYARQRRPESRRRHENARLLQEIKRVYLANRKIYGSPRIHEALCQAGIPCGRHRIARLMRLHGIKAKAFQRKSLSAKCDTVFPAENLLRRCFKTSGPDRVWLSDITSLRTQKGWLYLAVVLDLYSRRVVGWAMREDMGEKLVVKALEMALLNRNQAPEIFHSDQGGQYMASSFRERLRQYRIQRSMSRKGNCYDNAVAESFFKTVKQELVSQTKFHDREEAKSALFEYIEVFYNRRRLHSSLGYKSPAAFEQKPYPLGCPQW